jgi:prepilin-type N-terminal cleavage/methylation domain-containing protein
MSSGRRLPIPHPSRRNASGSHDGFTLLEVLAAVMILTIWYLPIASAAIQGLRAEGENLRQLEAGMIADRQLAKIEARVLLGDVPAVGAMTDGEGIFTVLIEVGPFSGAGEAESAPPLGQTQDQRIQRPRMQQLIEASAPDLGKHLRQIDVVVQWQEGPGEESVKRTTFAFDLVQARELYAQDPDLDAARDLAINPFTGASASGVGGLEPLPDDPSESDEPPQ